jgi:hypothetical protein
LAENDETESKAGIELDPILRIDRFPSVLFGGDLCASAV